MANQSHVKRVTTNIANMSDEALAEALAERQRRNAANGKSGNLLSAVAAVAPLAVASTLPVPPVVTQPAGKLPVKAQDAAMDAGLQPDTAVAVHTINGKQYALISGNLVPIATGSESNGHAVAVFGNTALPRRRATAVELATELNAAIAPNWQCKPYRSTSGKGAGKKDVWRFSLGATNRPDYDRLTFSYPQIEWIANAASNGLLDACTLFMASYDELWDAANPHEAGKTKTYGTESNSVAFEKAFA